MKRPVLSATAAFAFGALAATTFFVVAPATANVNGAATNVEQPLDPIRF